MSSPETVTLRALEGEPLRDEPVRDMVEATARAIAERHGVTLLRIDTTPSSISVTVDGERLLAIGLVAELRRLTTSWYRHKFGGAPLWGDAPPATEGGEGPDEPWT